MRKNFVRIFAIPLTAASLSWAGVQMESVDESLSDGKKTTQTIRVDENRMMVDVAGESGRHSVAFFGDQQLFRTIDHGKRTYREMTQQDVEKLGAQMNDAMAKLEEQMKNMPPAQREMMEKMMKGKMSQMMNQTSARPVYTAAGSGKVGQWDCARYEGVSEGRKVSEVCTVEVGHLGFQPSEFAVMQKVAEFFAQAMPPGLKDRFMVGTENWQEVQGFPGVPVSRSTFRGGKEDHRSTVTSVVRMDFEDSLFEVPAGYRKEAMPRMGGL